VSTPGYATTAVISYLKTAVAAERLDVPPYRLTNLVRYRRIPAPPKDSSGDFLWSPADLERARQALAAGRRRKGVSV
jgi:hypothetical protein